MPALLGGLFIGVLSALPVVQICNCCCLWIIGGGLLAAYLKQQNQPVSLTLMQGAQVGLFAGLIGSVVRCQWRPHICPSRWSAGSRVMPRGR